MAPTTPTNAQRLYKALHRKYRSERVPITDVVLQIKENAKIHNDSLGRKHEKMIEEAIAAAARRGHIQVNWVKRRIRVKPDTQKMLDGMKRQLKHIHDETEKYYAFMALVPDTFGRLQDKTKAQLRVEIQCLKREHKKCPIHSGASSTESDETHLDHTMQQHSRLSYSVASTQTDVGQTPDMLIIPHSVPGQVVPSLGDASRPEDAYPSPNSPRRPTALSPAASPPATPSPHPRQALQSSDENGMDLDELEDQMDTDYLLNGGSFDRSPSHQSSPAPSLQSGLQLRNPSISEMDQDRIVIDHAGDYNGNGSDQDPFVPSPMDSVHRRTTLSTPSPHVYRASQSNDNNVLHLNGLDDRAKEHLTAFVGCYSMARSEIVQLRTDKKALQARCEKEADAAKQLLQEKHTLQKAMGELLPREDILDEYQRSVQNARALVADYSDGSVRSSDGSCVVQ